MATAVGLLHVESSDDGNVLRQSWTGKANELKPLDVLDVYFAPIVERARACELTIEHHFENLEYFNSLFISWVIRHVRGTVKMQVKMKIYFDPRSSMHRSSFEALRMLYSNNPWLEVRDTHAAR